MATTPAAQRFTSFEDALVAFQVPVPNRPEMRRIASQLGATRFEIPPTQPYISASLADGPVLAYFLKGRVDVHEGPGMYRQVLMSVTFERAGGGRRAPAEHAVQLCPVHNVALLPAGECAWCD